MWKKPLVLPIKYHTDESIQLRELNITTSNEESYDIRDMYFYQIVMIGPSYTEGETLIYCSGEAFETPISLEDVLKMIEQHNSP